jgi:hypothetical protein
MTCPSKMYSRLGLSVYVIINLMGGHTWDHEAALDLARPSDSARLPKPHGMSCQRSVDHPLPLLVREWRILVACYARPGCRSTFSGILSISLTYGKRSRQLTFDFRDFDGDQSRDGHSISSTVQHRTCRHMRVCMLLSCAIS